MKKGDALVIRINKDNKTATTTTIGKHRKSKGLERKWTSRDGRMSDSSESSAHNAKRISGRLKLKHAKKN